MKLETINRIHRLLREDADARRKEYEEAVKNFEEAQEKVYEYSNGNISDEDRKNINLLKVYVDTMVTNMQKSRAALGDFEDAEWRL